MAGSGQPHTKGEGVTMKVAICERPGCRREGVLRVFGGLPAGWVELRLVQATGSDVEVQFCGMRCAGRWATEQAESEGPASGLRVRS